MRGKVLDPQSKADRHSEALIPIYLKVRIVAIQNTDRMENGPEASDVQAYKKAHNNIVKKL